MYSVVIPLYNKEKYIERAIFSVLRQSYSNFEIIIVDDGSSDKGPVKVSQIKDNRIKLLTQNHKGVSTARNLGVLEAKSDWIAFLDADDEFIPTYLEEVDKIIQKCQNQNLTFIGTDYYIVNGYKESINKCFVNGIHDYFSLFNGLKSPNNSSNTIVQKKSFFRVGGFPVNLKHYEDWICWIKLAFIGNYYHINKPLSKYYVINDSVSNNTLDYYELTKCAIYLSETIKIEINKLSKKDSKAISANSLRASLMSEISIILMYNLKIKEGLRILADSFNTPLNIVKKKKVLYAFCKGLTRKVLTILMRHR